MLRHRILGALVLAALLTAGRGAVAFANANACWNTAFNDPARVDIADISNLVAKTVLYADPMDAARSALLVVPRSSSREPSASTPAIDDASPGAHRPRAPPAV